MAMVSPERNWKSIQEFPEYEINGNGIIRNKETHIQKSTYEDGRGLEVAKFQKDGRRVLRSVEKMKRFAFSI